MPGETINRNSEDDPTPESAEQVLFDIWLISGDLGDQFTGPDTAPFYFDEGARQTRENPN